MHSFLPYFVGFNVAVVVVVVVAAGSAAVAAAQKQKQSAKEGTNKEFPDTLHQLSLAGSRFAHYSHLCFRSRSRCHCHCHHSLPLQSALKAQPVNRLAAALFL